MEAYAETLVAEDHGYDTPVVDVVVPVYNEAHVLERSIRRLHSYLSGAFPFAWRITIADNASTDGTAAVASALATELDGIRVRHVDVPGRGLALRTSWLASDATVLAYMDVDLSTGLDALLPLAAPLVSGHSDVAIGSRLSAGANVARGPRRETISRLYNFILRAVFSTRFHDAQCGFKAIRADVARTLLPAVADDRWFFDTELLLLAERNGLRIHEVPVDWQDDPDSRVHVARTAREDLRGILRIAREFARGRGHVDLGSSGRSAFVDDYGRRLVTFALVGVASTAVSLLLFLLLRSIVDPIWAVVIALAATSLGNAWAHRRFTMGMRGRVGLRHHANASALLTIVSIVGSVLVLSLVDRFGGALPVELVALGVVWTATTATRFAVLSRTTRADTHRAVGMVTGRYPPNL